MVGLTEVLLAVVVVQLGLIIRLLKKQTGMIQAASDLNLEAHQRLHEEVWGATHRR